MAVPSFEAEAIRPHVGGRFADLLRAAVTHPLMLAYLDQARSVGPNSPAGKKARRGLNENLAREVLELHTLGVEADYGQADVGQFAELLTGLTTDIGAGRTEFRAGRAEPGRGDGARPSLRRRRRRHRRHPRGRSTTSRRIPRRRGTSRASSPSISSRTTRRPVSSTISRPPTGGPTATSRSVYAALLEHPASWTDPGAKVRQPFDFVVASLRAAGPRNADEVAALLATGEKPAVAAVLREMNQPLWSAPGPDGWPEAAEAWITAPGLTSRINWASRMGEALAGRTDPRSFLDVALGERTREETAASSSAGRPSAGKASRSRWPRRSSTADDRDQPPRAARPDPRDRLLPRREPARDAGDAGGRRPATIGSSSSFCAARSTGSTSSRCATTRCSRSCGRALRTASAPLDLDGRFGMHPALAPLLPLWSAGQLAVVQAVATPYRDKRSHFDGQDLLETGMTAPLQARDGWLNRALAGIPGARAETALSVGREGMLLLRGAEPVQAWAPGDSLTLAQ